MTQTLKQFTADERALLLARIARRYLPNPGIDPPLDITPEDEAIQARILEEIKAHLRITSEAEPEAKKALIDYLSEGMSRAVLENADLKAIEHRLGQRGELPISSYKVKFGDMGKDSSSESGLTTNSVRVAIYHADEIQHLHYSEPERPGKDLSLFLKHHLSPDRDSYTLLVIGRREGNVIHVENAWRVYHLEVELSSAHTPLDFLRAFIDVYGLEIQVGDRSGKFITEVFVPQHLLSTRTNFIQGMEKSKDFSAFAFMKPVQGLIRKGAEVGMAFAIDMSKYKTDLRRHGVKVPKS